jgi:hypothetical protein
VAVLLSSIVNAVDVRYLQLTDVQLSSFLHALSWHMGGSTDDVDGFVVGESNQEAGTLTVYWVKGNALGSLTVTRPPEGSSAQPPIDGWMRSLKKVQKLDLTVDIRFDQFTKEKDVRPGVRVHFRDLEQPIEVFASELPNQKARDEVAKFIKHLRNVLSRGDVSAD